MAVGGGVAALLAMAACSPGDPRPGQNVGRVPASAAAAPDLTVDRLHPPVQPLSPFSPPTRNPFRFLRSPADDSSPQSARAPLPPPDGLPVLPLPLPQPPMRLLGFVTLVDGNKLAVLSVGSDLVMARVGETLVGRFRVVRIDDDAVDLIDAVGERPVRISLP